MESGQGPRSDAQRWECERVIASACLVAFGIRAPHLDKGTRVFLAFCGTARPTLQKPGDLGLPDLLFIPPMSPPEFSLSSFQPSLAEDPQHLLLARAGLFSPQLRGPTFGVGKGRWVLKPTDCWAAARGFREPPIGERTPRLCPPARPAPSHARHVRPGLRPPSALRPPLSSRSPLGRVCASATDSVAAPAPSSVSSPPPPPGASGGRLPGWPRAAAVALASCQRPPQEEARRPRSHLGPQFSLYCRRRGSWRSGRGRGTGRRGSNGR